jgi:tetratricopeptide (TPR) repeat protein
MKGTSYTACGLAALALAATAARPALAQSADSTFARARQLVVGGNGAAGRLVIDSIISANPPGVPIYGEALYWRAALAASSADAERDYRRVIVEYPLSPHTSDALYALAQLESARGDRAAATNHLEQFLADNPHHEERPRATMLFVRLLLEQNQLPRGCTALRQTIAELPDTQVETRNQLEYYLPRCEAADVGAGGAAPVGAASPAKSSRESGKPVPTVSPKARYTLQIAAYKSRTEAEALVKKLVARGMDARVVELSKLYRVRVGKYVTREGALAAQRELKAKKITTVLTDIEPAGK